MSINEVALTLVGAALDRYGKKYGQQPDKQLLATCPMALRSAGDTDASTQIAAITVKLGDASMNIQQRLQQLHESSRDAKEDAKDMSKEAMDELEAATVGARKTRTKKKVAARRKNGLAPALPARSSYCM